MQTATMQWATKGDLVLLVEGTVEHPDSEWGEFLRTTSECMQSHRHLIRVLVLTDGAGPNAGQRQMSIKAGWENNRSPVAVVSKSLLVRGIITAFAWFNLNIRSFSENDHRAAFAFLRLTPAEIDWVRAEASRMRAALALSSLRLSA